MLRNILNACIDHVLAPECAFDRHSDGYAFGGAPGSAVHGQGELFPQHEPQWHNNWGTAPDYQALTDNAALVPAPPTSVAATDSPGGFMGGMGGSSYGGSGCGFGDY